MSLRSLPKYNKAFVCTADYQQQKAEVFSLVLEKPEVVQFHLMIAKSAHKASLLYPDPVCYLNQLAGNVNQFFRGLDDVSYLMEQLAILASVAENASERKFTRLVNMIARVGSEQLVGLLYFLLYSSPDLNPLRLPLGQICCHPRSHIQAYSFSYSPEEEDQFARKGRYRWFLFHGTNECNLYSILRNGIKPSFGKYVYMSSYITTSWMYARSHNKVILCFEVRMNEVVSRDDLNEICVRVDVVLPRVLLWFEGQCRCDVGRVGARLLNHLHTTIRV